MQHVILIDALALRDCLRELHVVSWLDRDIRGRAKLVLFQSVWERAMGAMHETQQRALTSIYSEFSHYDWFVHADPLPRNQTPLAPHFSALMSSTRQDLADIVYARYHIGALGAQVTWLKTDEITPWLHRCDFDHEWEMGNTPPNWD
jgi:hypothetical protein